MKDVFRPRTDPARLLYDAFQAEAEKRPGRPVEFSVLSERAAVWRAARDYAQQHGLRVPTLVEVEKAERLAMGHVDYGAKWAYGVAELLGPESKEPRR
jgi:hypothetical protein